MKKIKHLLADDRIFFSILLVAVGLAAFGIGRLSVAPGQQQVPPAGVRMLQEATVVQSSVNNEVEATPVVAARSGTRYYFPHCSGIDRINEENRIFFTSVAEAEAAGYTLARTCAAN